MRCLTWSVIGLLFERRRHDRTACVVSFAHSLSLSLHCLCHSLRCAVLRVRTKKLLICSSGMTASSSASSHFGMEGRMSSGRAEEACSRGLSALAAYSSPRLSCAREAAGQWAGEREDGDGTQ